MANKNTLYVRGMHCASCEILIEKKLMDIPGIKSVSASAEDGKVILEYDGIKPEIKKINNLFEKDGYLFSENKYNNEQLNKSINNWDKPVNKTLLAFNISIFIIIAFLLLDRIGLSSFLNVGSTSSLIVFLGFGLLAGISSCAALVGGIVLSMSKQWAELYDKNESSTKKFQPHIMFNMGRIASYAIGGALLGLIGSKMQISLSFVAFLVIGVSLLMIALGLQMLGIKYFRKFQITVPKFITKYATDENNFKGKYMPFIMGALTFILPCGFTITTQTIALLTGSPVQGFLIMTAFALGTAPTLLLIGLSSSKLFSKPHFSETFSKVAGFLVIFFALFNISNQMNVLGLDFETTPSTQNTNSTLNMPPIVDGKQVIKMTVFGDRYSPNRLTVKIGIPVKWEIISSGEPSCDSGAVISNILPNGSVYLNPDKNAVTIAEFLPNKIGVFKFSCPMGMVRGSIEVVK